MRLSTLILFSALTVASAATPASADGGPPSRPAPTAIRAQVEGVVVERLAAGSYTYLRVRQAGWPGELTWVVTMGSSVPVGSHAVIAVFGEQHPFASRRLGRTFDRFLFGSVAVTGQN